MAHQGFDKVAQNQGCGGRSPQPPTNFYGFYIKKNTHLGTLFIGKGRAVPAVSALSKKQYKNILPKNLGVSESRSLAKINKGGCNFISFRAFD